MRWPPARKAISTLLSQASGPPSALRNYIETVRPGSVIVQLGLGGGDMSVPAQMVTAKELKLRGSFRFHEEFAVAVDYIDEGMIDVNPLISATLPFTQALVALEFANDRSKPMKVQLAKRSSRYLAHFAAATIFEGQNHKCF
jgi:L-idonate 5-dehydrogenase